MGLGKSPAGASLAPKMNIFPALLHFFYLRATKIKNIGDWPEPSPKKGPKMAQKGSFWAKGRDIVRKKNLRFFCVRCLGLLRLLGAFWG